MCPSARYGLLHVTTNASVTGPLAVTGTATIAALAVPGTATVGTIVASAASISAISGTSASFGSNLTAANVGVLGSLTTGGTATFSGGLRANVGLTALQSSTFLGAVTSVGGDLEIGTSCLSFDGVRNYASLPVGTVLSSSVVNTFTMEFWALPTATRAVTTASTTGMIGTSGQRYAIFPRWYAATSDCGAGVSVGTNGISVVEHSSGYMPTVIVHAATISVWTHVAVVYTAKTPSLFINGVFARTGVASPIATVHPSASIGGDPGFFQDYGVYAGLLDDVRVWSVARTAADLLAARLTYLPPTTSGLLAYFPLDESQGLVANDLSNGYQLSLGGNNTATAFLPIWSVGSPVRRAAVTKSSGTTFATASTSILSPSVTIGAPFAGQTVIQSPSSTFSGPASFSAGFAAAGAQSTVSDLKVGAAPCYLNFNLGSANTAVVPQAVANSFTMELWAYPLATRVSNPEATSGAPGTSGQRYAVYPHYFNAAGQCGVGLSIGTNGFSVYEHQPGNLQPTLNWDTSLFGWNHFAVVYTAKRPALYINGQLVHLGVTSLCTMYPGLNLGDAANSYGPWIGLIDEYRVWSAAISASQIAANWRRPVSPSSANLYAYFPLDECSGTQIRDLSPSGFVSNFAGTTPTWVAGSSLNLLSTSGSLSAGSVQTNQLTVGPIFQSYKSIGIANSYTTVVTVVMPIHSSVKISIQLNGDWCCNSAVAYDTNVLVRSSDGVYTPDGGLFYGSQIFFRSANPCGTANPAVNQQVVCEPYSAANAFRNCFLQFATNYVPCGPGLWQVTATYTVSGSFFSAY